MAKCPTCGRDVHTPFFLNLEGWSHLTCAQCNARLEMKPPRSPLFAPLMASLFVLARKGWAFEVAAYSFMFGLIFVLLLECLDPKIQLRKAPLEPEIRLDINDQSS